MRLTDPIALLPFSIAEAADVSLTLYDMQGRRLAAGSYEVDFDADGLASGVYFYRIAAGQNERAGRMTVVR